MKVALAIVLVACGPEARAQYMFLDANGDGVSTSSDRLNSTGATVLTIYLNTNHDRDGSPQSCNSHTAACGATTTTQALNMFSYTISLVAVGGTVQWGTFTPANAAYAPLGTDPSDNTSIEVNRLRPAGTFTPPGLSILGSIPVTILSGTPRIDIAHGPTTANPFGSGTGFGTMCDGFNSPHTYVLGDPANRCGSGGDWFDTDGLSEPAGIQNMAPTFYAPSVVNAVSGTAFSLSVEALANTSDTTAVGAIGTYPGWVMEQKMVSLGRVVAVIRGMVPNSEPTGERLITWSTTDGRHSPTLSTTLIRVTQPLDRDTDFDMRVREFVTRSYHGFPTFDAQKLGPTAVPILEALLRDPAFKHSWANIAQTIGAIGAPDAFDSLRAFVWARFRGAIDDTTFNGIVAAQVAMWRVAPTRPEVVQYLEKCSDPSFWTSLPWRLATGPPRGLFLSMSKISINSLSCIVTPSAIQSLENLHQRPFDSAQLQNIVEGIEREDRILRIGREANFYGERRSLTGSK